MQQAASPWTHDTRALSAAAAAAARTVAGCQADRSSGPIRSEKRTVKAFSRIDVGGRTNATVTVRRGSKPTVMLRGGRACSVTPRRRWPTGPS
jgi:hypothetical protein